VCGKCAKATKKDPGLRMLPEDQEREVQRKILLAELGLPLFKRSEENAVNQDGSSPGLR